MGLSVQPFASALEFLALNPVEAEGCVVLDVEMPGMNGLDLQREMNGSGIFLPVIFLTGHGDIPMTVHALKAGAVHFLTKPVREDELMNAIRQALENDRNARSERAEIRKLRERFDCWRPVSARSCGWWFQDGSTSKSRMSLASASEPLSYTGAKLCARWALNLWLNL